ncbi:NAD-dependent epimerase/dehydratase family protein [Flavobacterium yafengii]|uniref:NAD-dependent epimerase/dehydratase family protein n=1 Tax=Flavobacterium yafengii TaxID=3041253 RepID=UPI0024A8990F|nr:NAD(P)-dependent oxidoreductase [Flavobacterium yafengii]MDI5899187.1 NAD(P)-dependent oxidoreductase [Flavobacterium yafengii]
MIKHILITGGTGYLGSHIIKELLSQGYAVSVLIRIDSSLSRLELFKEKLDFVNVDNVEVFFEKEKISGIIHVATNYGRKAEKVSDIISSNLSFPIKLFELAIQNKVGFFINTDTSLPRNLNAYSLSKAQFRDWLKMVPNELKIINVIPEYFYGSNDDDTKFITGMLHKLKRNVESIDLSEGIQKRDFIYIDDAISAYICLIENLDKFEQYVDIPLGSASTISLRSLVELIKKMAENTKTKLNFGKIPIREGDVMESKADISYLLSLGWKPTICIEEGINKIIDIEYKENK